MESMPQRIEVVSRVKGGLTQYWCSVPIKVLSECMSARLIGGISVVNEV